MPKPKNKLNIRNFIQAILFLKNCSNALELTPIIATKRINKRGTINIKLYSKRYAIAFMRNAGSFKMKTITGR